MKIYTFSAIAVLFRNLPAICNRFGQFVVFLQYFGIKTAILHTLYKNSKKT